jgi:hypothetical protein
MISLFIFGVFIFGVLCVVVVVGGAAVLGAGERGWRPRSDGEQSPAVLPAAGWYPNPNGGPGERYWNGVAWELKRRRAVK